MDKKRTRLKFSSTVSFILAVIMVISLGVFIAGIMEYNEIIREQAAVRREIEKISEEIDWLEYEIEAEIDDDYIERVAREKLGLVYPDEVIVYSNENK